MSSKSVVSTCAFVWFILQVFTKKRGVDSLYGSTEVRTYFSAGYVSDIKLLRIKQLNICLDLAKPAQFKDAVLARPSGIALNVLQFFFFFKLI